MIGTIHCVANVKVTKCCRVLWHKTILETVLHNTFLENVAFVGTTRDSNLGVQHVPFAQPAEFVFA